MNVLMEKTNLKNETHKKTDPQKKTFFLVLRHKAFKKKILSIILHNVH